MRCGRLAEISIGEIYIDSVGAVPCVVCPVEQIKDFKPELEIDSFRDAIVLVEIDIRLDKVWPTELHGLLISVLTKRRNCEVALRDRSRQPSAIGG